jgi:hypothetical protein
MAHPVRFMLESAKHRAKRKGVPFNLTEADIEIPTHCPALGVPLVTRERGDSTTFDYPYSPSLDRIRPELGYVRGNVVVISDLANRIKHTATADQIEAVAHWLRSLG